MYLQTGVKPHTWPILHANVCTKLMLHLVYGSKLPRNAFLPKSDPLLACKTHGSGKKCVFQMPFANTKDYDDNGQATMRAHPPAAFLSGKPKYTNRHTLHSYAHAKLPDAHTQTDTGTSTQNSVLLVTHEIRDVRKLAGIPHWDSCLLTY
jgi:hypothetical protein